ncbi:hypothetical protein HDU76_004810 [Blyttiomyces sp. JEL0837]|nr:hypothetical protein HDU76_004810 [Blyttiomyces sp. JEL0837]
MQFVEGKIAAVFGGYQTVTIVMKPHDSSESDHPYKYVVFVIVENPLREFGHFQDPVDYMLDVKTRYQIGGIIGIIEPLLEFDSVGRKIIKVSNPKGQLIIHTNGHGYIFFNRQLNDVLFGAKQLYVRKHTQQVTLTDKAFRYCQKIIESNSSSVTGNRKTLAAAQIDCRLEAKELCKKDQNKDSDFIQEVLAMKLPRPKDYSPGFHTLSLLNKLDIVSIKSWLEP